MSDVLHLIGTLHDPDPKNVYRRVLKELSDYYTGATAILSILQGDYLVFRGVEGGPGSGKELAELNQFLKQFEQMKDMMKMMNKMPMGRLASLVKR
jgi:hypothetical protein